MINHLRFARSLTHLLDKNFNFFGFRFGLDPLLGLIPGLGDLVSLILSFYIIWIATGMGLPEGVIRRMWFNAIFDFGLGLVPVIGDLSDFVYKANSKNLALLERHASLTVIDGEPQPVFR